MDFTVCDLRQQPQFLDTVAERIWRAWWEPEGHRLDHLTDRLRDCLDDDPLPFAVVAHAAGRYIGSAVCIASDLAERPEYSPWIAAVWVDPQHRLRHVGRTLVGHAMRACFGLGFERIYLCSVPERRSFYTHQGWVPIEENVGPHAQTVYVCEAGAFGGGA
ncbi:GNAT family N-acetyltransferase [Vineibacter terrae]|uniref:GNAT family N-acetyltransferase n=1 Tax=Vineibacter terrae TaxID=2586908 RepID=A0A5C8PMV0_9HYPH|nr:GNAT family N-acetyltransferase [Vineibacter terrae]TXL75740.1 GNAT family N-acetyltransferase [Vineibacter terrae]HEX2890262.1 GNAT family N-acetyltransferase [Vineibacter terrae]